MYFSIHDINWYNTIYIRIYIYYYITTVLCVYIPWVITPALTFPESFLGMGPPWIPNIEAEWLRMDYEGCDPSNKRLCGSGQSPGVHRCSFARIREGKSFLEMRNRAACRLGLCRLPQSLLWFGSHPHTGSMCRDSICAFKRNASNISRSGFEKNWRQYYDIDIRQRHLLGPLGPHRPQRPLQGLTQPETQRTISRNNEKQRFLTQSCWTRFVWFKAKSWSKTS